MQIDVDDSNASMIDNPRAQAKKDVFRVTWLFKFLENNISETIHDTA